MSADGEQAKGSSDPGVGNHVLRAEAKPFVPLFSAFKPTPSVVVGFSLTAQPQLQAQFQVQPQVQLQPQFQYHHHQHHHHHPSQSQHYQNPQPQPLKQRQPQHQQQLLQPQDAASASVQVGVAVPRKVSISPAHYDEDGKLMYRARMSYHQDPASQRNLAELEYRLGYRSSTRKVGPGIPRHPSAVYVDGGVYAMFNVDANEPTSATAALQAEVRKRNALDRRNHASASPQSSEMRDTSGPTGTASTGVLYNPFIDPIALRTEEAVTKLLDDESDLGCEGLLEAVRRIEQERSDEQPANGEEWESGASRTAPGGALLKVPVVQPQVLQSDMGSASAAIEVEPIGPASRPAQQQAVVSSNTNTNAAKTTSPTPPVVGSGPAATVTSALPKSPAPALQVRSNGALPHQSTATYFHSNLQPHAVLGPGMVPPPWLLQGNAPLPPPPPMPSIPAMPSMHHGAPGAMGNRRTPQQAPSQWSSPYPHNSSGGDSGVAEAPTERRAASHPTTNASLLASGGGSAASLNSTAVDSSVGPHDLSEDLTAQGIASFSVSEPVVSDSLKVNAETFFSSGNAAQNTAANNGSRNPFSLQSLQGVRRAEAAIPLQKVLWSRVYFRDAETWVPPPFEPIPDELVRLYNGSKHYDVARPATHPHVALHLYQYRCNACPIDVYPGKINERPADIKLGGICGDVPALCVAHLVEVITGVKIEAIDMFGNNLGRCNLWLQNPSQVAELTSKFDRKMWMSPVVHGYAVVVSTDEGREYLLWYLEGLRAHGPKSVRFPRHLVTCEKWLA